MIGAGTTISVAGSVYPPAGHNKSSWSQDAHPTSQTPTAAEGNGPLAAITAALSQRLGSSGFVDISAPFVANFASSMHYTPGPGDCGDLKPGALKELLAYMKRKLAADPQEALGAQAHVPAPAAVKLLQ